MPTSGFFYLCLLVILAVFAVSAAQTAGYQDGLLHVRFFDIGQGDAIFIQAPNGNQVLIDGGPDSKVMEKLEEVMLIGDWSLDAVIVSHPHSDHITGLVDVLDAYDVGVVVQARESYDSAIFRQWQVGVEQEGAIQVEALPGKVLDLGNEVTLTVIHPTKSYEGVSLKEPHEANVTVLLKYHNFELLLTGDMEADAERFLVNADAPIDVDVLKIGHHGSKTSSSTEFLTATSPDAAVISVGAKNKYGHPAPSVLSRLENFGIKYYRTDIDGDIHLATDGGQYILEAY